MEEMRCPKCGVPLARETVDWGVTRRYTHTTDSIACLEIQLGRQKALCESLRADRDRLQSEVDVMMADAALGRMVRGMEMETGLCKDRDGWWIIDVRDGMLCVKAGSPENADTPEAALEVKRDDQ